MIKVLNKQIFSGVAISFVIAVLGYMIGKEITVIGGPVSGMFLGMVISLFWKDKSFCQSGIDFVTKKILQMAIILLGIGMNFMVVMKMGMKSFPIILTTIATALIVAYLLSKIMKIDSEIATLIGVGSSICGGSAIAATASVIKPSNEKIAQSISVIFLFNIIAAVIFPKFGYYLGLSNEGFGIFAGTAINDTSSVTAASTTWDFMYGSNTLEIATVVKLTRTLAIIPITIILGIIYNKKNAEKLGSENKTSKSKIKKVFDLVPNFIILFLMFAILTTVMDINGEIISFARFLSKFLIIMAMSAIGLNTDLVKLVKTGGKPILLGLVCWICIIGMSLSMQRILGYW